MPILKVPTNFNLPLPGEVSPNPDAADAAAPSPPSPPEPVEPPSLEPEENGAEQLAEPEPPEEAAKRERENTAEDGRRPYVESNVVALGTSRCPGFLGADGWRLKGSSTASHCTGDHPFGTLDLGFDL